MNTGEYPVAEPVSITRLTVPVVLVAGLAGALIALGAFYSSVHSQLADHETRISKGEARMEPIPLEIQHVDDRLDVLERGQDKQAQSLDRIETRLGTKP